MDYRELLDKGRDLNNAGKFAEAIELFKQLEPEGKTDPRWAYRYGYALIYTNQFKKALEVLEHLALKEEYPYPYVYGELGILYYWQGKLIEAFEAMRKAKKLSEKNCPENTWEFDQYLWAMYRNEPFANPENWENSVISNDFTNYDATADREIKVKDIEEEKKILSVYFGDYPRKREYYELNLKNENMEDDTQIIKRILNFEIALFLRKLGLLIDVDFIETNDSNESYIVKFDAYADLENYQYRIKQIVDEFFDDFSGFYSLRHTSNPPK